MLKSAVDYLPQPSQFKTSSSMLRQCCAGAAGAPEVPVTLGPYYYTIRGPAGSLLDLPVDQAASAVIRALHSAIALPDSYPLGDIHAKLVSAQNESSMLPAHRHLLVDDSTPQARGSQPQQEHAGQATEAASSHAVDEPHGMRHLSAAQGSGSSTSAATAVWSIHLLSYTSNSETLHTRMTAEYAASDLVFRLALAGYVDPGSLAVVQAGFAPSLAHALEVVNDNSTEGARHMHGMHKPANHYSTASRSLELQAK